MQVFETGKGGGKKRKSASATSGEGKKPAAKKAKKMVRLETDDEDEEDASGGGGSPAFDFDDVDEDAFGYYEQDGEEDADALEAMRQLEPSSYGVDEAGWAGVKTASKPRAGRRKSVEVLELDD
jgi:hypothetical protein